GELAQAVEAHGQFLRLERLRVVQLLAALPFVYLGMLNPEAAKPQVFISSGDRLLIVSPGDVIDGVYRFESIAATEARFTYLPLNQRQVMSVQGEGN
ncbi:hypothetical protein ACQCSI_25230, partial [Ralstonia pseudosolanacearum]